MPNHDSQHVVWLARKYHWGMGRTSEDPANAPVEETRFLEYPRGHAHPDEEKEWKRIGKHTKTIV